MGMKPYESKAYALELGMRIKEQRVKAGQTQAEAADGINTSVQHLSDIERGRSLPSLALISRISDFYDVSLDVLAKGSPVNRSIGKLDAYLNMLDPKKAKIVQDSFETILSILADEYKNALTYQKRYLSKREKK